MLALDLAAAAGLAAAQPVEPGPATAAEASIAPAVDAAPAEIPDPLEVPAPEFAAPPPEDPAAPAAVQTASEDDPLLEEIELPSDPLEPFNRISFGFSWAVDKVLIRPAAMTYRHVVPKPARDGARNALNNFGEPLVFANDLLQLRPKRALRTLGRFLINTTLGLGGLFDIAKRKPFNLPHRINSFGSTLAYYGVGPGPYIYIPILGPTTLRDITDNAQGFVWPGPVGKPFDKDEFTITTMVVDGLDTRERNDDDIKVVFGDSVDKYARFRADFLQDREGEVTIIKARDGEEPKTPGFEEPLIDPAPPAGPAEAAQP